MAHDLIRDRKPAIVERRPLGGSVIARSNADSRPSNIAMLRTRLGNQGTQALFRQRSAKSNSLDVGRTSAAEIERAIAPSMPALSISHPSDAYEQEAERVADTVMRMLEPASQPIGISAASSASPPSSVQRLCAECEDELSRGKPLANQPIQGSGVKVQRKEGMAATPNLTPSVSANIRALQGGGSPLSSATRGFFEPRFGANFSDVRVHTGARAGETAKAINAKAFTVGRDIAFANGQYAPDSHAGKRLLAHELTHVVQQGAGNTDAYGVALSVQRTIGDRQNLESPRFKGNPDLEGCYNDQIRLTMNGKGKSGTRKVEHGLSVKAVQDALLELGYLASESAYGLYNEATWNAVKALKKDKGLGWEEMGDVGPSTLAWLDKKFSPTPWPCPPCPEPQPPSCPSCSPICPPCSATGPRPAECLPCREPIAHVCGPDIDAQLTKVLREMQTYFRALSGWEKHFSCWWLIQPPMAIMAWDINQLYLPETQWLRTPPFSPPCGRPSASPDGSIEDPAFCTNSVRVGGKCNLAGTVNYATFGILMKECYDYYSGSPAVFTMKHINRPFYTESRMRMFISLWNIFDDKGPPTEFAEATYLGGPSARPVTENRKHCTGVCASSGTLPTFTFVWEPYKSGPGR